MSSTEHSRKTATNGSHIDEVADLVLNETLLQRAELLQRLSIQSNRAISLFTFSGVLFFAAMNNLDGHLFSLVSALLALASCLLLISTFRNRKGPENCPDRLEADLIETGGSQLRRVYRSRVLDIMSADKSAFAIRSIHIIIALWLVAAASCALLASVWMGV